MSKPTKSVTDYFRSGVELDAAVRRAVREALKAKRTSGGKAKSAGRSTKRKDAA